MNQRGEPICYRGILMPFSSDGDTIDFIYGVINWKRGEGAAVHRGCLPRLRWNQRPILRTSMTMSWCSKTSSADPPRANS